MPATVGSGWTARGHSDQRSARDNEVFLRHRRELGTGEFQTLEQFQAELELARRRSLEEVRSGCGINSNETIGKTGGDPVGKASGAGAAGASHGKNIAWMPRSTLAESGGPNTSLVDDTVLLNRSLRRFGFNETDAINRARALAVHDGVEEARESSPVVIRRERPTRSGPFSPASVGEQRADDGASASDVDRAAIPVAATVEDSVPTAVAVAVADQEPRSPARSPGGSRCEYYAVFRGRIPGVYRHWSLASLQVQGFPGNSYRGYRTLEEAMEAMRSAGLYVRGEGPVNRSK